MPDRRPLNDSPVHWRNKSGRTHMQSKTRHGMGGAPHPARTAFMWSVAGWKAASNQRFSSSFWSNPSGVVSGCERRPKSTLVISRGTTPQPTIGGRLFLGPSNRGKAPKYGTSTRIRSIGLSAMIWRIHLVVIGYRISECVLEIVDCEVDAAKIPLIRKEIFEATVVVVGDPRKGYKV
jgi:hypothetical protein